MPNPKICVVLGAGASYDVFNGFGDGYGLDDEFRMPLTSQLFDVRFLQKLDEYPGARVLAQELGPLAQSGTLNLEDRLGESRVGAGEDAGIDGLSTEPPRNTGRLALGFRAS